MSFPYRSAAASSPLPHTHPHPHPHPQVHETDPRFGAAASFQEYLNEAPPELRPLFSLANSIPWYREEEFRWASGEEGGKQQELVVPV